MRWCLGYWEREGYVGMNFFFFFFLGGGKGQVSSSSTFLVLLALGSFFLY